MKAVEAFRRIPKVDKVLATAEVARLVGPYPRVVVVRAVRQVLDGLRRRLGAGEGVSEAELELGAVAGRVVREVERLGAPSLRRVVNATGVVVHTNLGRSLLATQALERLVEVAKSYTNLEYDLKAGRRGSRYEHVAGLLSELGGAEAAMVVNNNAGAVLLTLNTLARGKEVVVSRGQLVEIGGSFRIPDVMAASGAILKEVGTTNKTHLYDYERAIGPDTAMLLKVHTSNFAIVGFHEEVPLREMAELAHSRGLVVMEDLGSGNLVDMTAYGLPPEPTVQQVLAEGADVVCFSGDKLLGAPQAGIILGKAKLIERIRKNPMNRALRIDKLTLAGLEATLELYREPARALEAVPTLRMITTPYKVLSARAIRLARRLKALGLERLKVSTRRSFSRVGGGAMPLAELPTRVVQVEVEGMSATDLEQALRGWRVPVICRLEDRQVLMDVRTMIPGDGQVVAEALGAIAGEG